jgi:hypothetical protein
MVWDGRVTAQTRAFPWLGLQYLPLSAGNYPSQIGLRTGHSVLGGHYLVQDYVFLALADGRRAEAFVPASLSHDIQAQARATERKAIDGAYQRHYSGP